MKKNHTSNLYEYIDVQIKSGEYSYPLSNYQVEEYIESCIQKMISLKIFSLLRTTDGTYNWELPEKEFDEVKGLAEKSVHGEIDAIKSLISQYIDTSNRELSERTTKDIITFYILIQEELKKFRNEMALIGAELPNIKHTKERSDIIEAPQDITKFRYALGCVNKIIISTQKKEIIGISIKSSKQSNYVSLPKVVLFFANLYLQKIPQIKESVELQLTDFCITKDTPFFKDVVSMLSYTIENCGFYSTPKGTPDKNKIEKPFYQRISPLYRYLMQNEVFMPVSFEKSRGEGITAFIIKLLNLIDYKAAKRKKSEMSFEDMLNDILCRDVGKQTFIIN